MSSNKKPTRKVDIELADIDARIEVYMAEIRRLTEEKRTIIARTENTGDAKMCARKVGSTV